MDEKERNYQSEITNHRAREEKHNWSMILATEAKLNYIPAAVEKIGRFSAENGRKGEAPEELIGWQFHLCTILKWDKKTPKSQKLLN